MYEELVKRLRKTQKLAEYAAEDVAKMPNMIFGEAADAIEELSRQRDRAYARLCEWCAVCPEGKRNAEDCEIAALNPEPPKEEA